MNLSEANKQASPLRQLLVRLRGAFWFVESHWALATQRTDWLLRRRFNQWARRGRGESMEQHHSGMAEPIWERMELCSADRILDLGCGQGWACRLIARRAPRGCLVVGLDISDEMIRRARENSRLFPSVGYHCGRAHEIPSPDSYFTKVISIEAFYYFERQEEVLRELLRVMQPGGQLYLLICLFQEAAQPKTWHDDVALPVRNRSISEYEDMLRSSGWVDVGSNVFDFRTGSVGGAHDHPLLISAKKPRGDADRRGQRLPPGKEP